MDDQETGTLGLSFEDPSKYRQVRQLIEFAELEIVDDPSNAELVLGDLCVSETTASLIAVDAPNIQSAIAYLQTPFTFTELFSALGLARGHIADRLNKDDASYRAAQSFVGDSTHAAEIRELICRSAKRDITVLVTGESGTGKEVVAQALHQGSERRGGPFVPVNCGAIPSELLESELFGHEKGAFTGAISRKIGRFELAQDGTLFLDEIGDLPFPMQVKLLRALEERSFERVGGSKSIASNARIVAATNQELTSKINNGDFREDLYYRLNVFPIEIEPLRDRPSDIPLLTSLLLARIFAEQKLGLKFSVDAMDVLCAYSWPGNGRELSNLLQRLSIQFPQALVRAGDLPNKYREQGALSVEQSSTTNEILLPVNGLDLKEYLTGLERSLIEQALQDANSVVARAADKLHIRRTTLVEKMRKHGLGRSLGEIQ